MACLKDSGIQESSFSTTNLATCARSLAGRALNCSFSGAHTDQNTACPIRRKIDVLPRLIPQLSTIDHQPSIISRLQCMSGSLLRMRLLEPGGVTLFESLLTSLQTTCSRGISELFTRALLLEILLRHHVQLSVRRRLRVAWRLLSGLLTAFISSSFFRRCAVSRAMSVEHRHATHDERCYSHQHKETHWLELSDHCSR